MIRKLVALLALLALLVTAERASAAVQTIIVINRTTGQNLSTLAVAADGVNGDKWTATGSEFLYVTNGAGAPITVTLTYGPGAAVDGQQATNRTISVPAGQSMLIGPFPTVFYADANGNMNISYSSATSVKILVLRLGT